MDAASESVQGGITDERCEGEQEKRLNMLITPIITLLIIVVGTATHDYFQRNEEEKKAKVVMAAIVVGVAYIGVLPVFIEMLGHIKEQILTMTALLSTASLMFITDL